MPAFLSLDSAEPEGMIGFSMSGTRKEKIVEFVRRTPLFKGVAAEQFEPIAARMRIVEEPRGQVLFRQDEPAVTFYLVVEGWVKIYRTTAAGDETIIGIFTRGESFAEIAAFAGGDYPAHCETVTDAVLAAIPTQAIVNAISEDPKVALTMLGSVSRHVRSLVDEIEQMKGLSGQQRVVEFLIDQSPVDSGACTIRLPYEKSVIAAKLGMKAESLSRVFQRMRKFGVVIKQDMAIINDIETLRETLEQDRMTNIRNLRSGI